MNDEIVADVTATVAQWRRRIELGETPPRGSSAWLASQGAVTEMIDGAFRRGIEVAAAAEWHSVDFSDADTARLLLVTKNPHADSNVTLGAILARSLAFGLQVHLMRRASPTEADKIARACYGTAWLHFERGPITESAWNALEDRFDCPEFRDIFGVSFDRSLVLSAATVLRSSGLSGEQLSHIWNEGRNPVSSSELAYRYGTAVADKLTSGQPAFNWFHCAWPIGIQQITPSLIAFAMKHPSIFVGKPVIVVNGHCLTLSDRFRTEDGRGCVLIEAGVSRTGPDVADVRSWLVGSDNTPEQCAIGTIRRDAASGDLPLRAGVPPVSPWANVLHCSDGYFAGLVETETVLVGPPRGLLRGDLDSLGYAEDEIQKILLQDPVVLAGAMELRLTERTRGLALQQCVDAIASYFPPVFGSGNKFGGGVSPGRLTDSLQTLAETNGDIRAFSAVDEPRRPILKLPKRERVIREEDEEAGLEILAGHGVGLLIPAAGTGGRFGGYHIPESDPRRHKALARAFRIADREVGTLDIRLANARYWIHVTGGRIPIAITTSSATRAGVQAWARGTGASGMQVTLCDQPGVYRFAAQRIGPQSTRESPFFREDFILRDSKGRPSMKAAGSFGLISSFILDGLLDDWMRDGVKFVAIANADDAGFRIDPSLLGLMRRSHHIEAVVLAVPVDARGSIKRANRFVEVRGDGTGWGLDELGRRVQFPKLDEFHPLPEVGGFLGELRGPKGWHTIVVDGAATGRRVDDYRYLSTNQIYMRTSALARIFLCGDDHIQIHEQLRQVRDSLPVYAERKIVKLGNDMQEAIQLFQPLGEILRAMSGVTAVSTSWVAAEGKRGAYIPLKRKNDTSFAQKLLDYSSSFDGELLLD
jgi:hypothetical protein